MTCPICKKKTQKAFRPFCSKRCADIDLGKWLNGEYQIPGGEPADLNEMEQALASENASGQKKLH